MINSRLVFTKIDSEEDDVTLEVCNNFPALSYTSKVIFLFASKLLINTFNTSSVGLGKIPYVHLFL